MVERLAAAVIAAALLVGGVLLLPGNADNVGDNTGAVSARGGTRAATAANKYGWFPAVFDFDWEYGEALTSKPARGKRLRGWWLDTSTGTGRAARHNGGMMLESKYGTVRPADAGVGDRGTTSMTLRGNAQKYGRWEVRIRPWVIENHGRDYRVRFELVPEDPAKLACGARTITVADLTPRKNEVLFGALTPRRKLAWRGRFASPEIERIGRSYAVEVAKDHISWFFDGQLIGSVRDRSAVPGVPLTIRLSLVGSDGAEMNHTYAIMDWARAYGIKNGKHPKRGPRLAKGHHTLGC